MNDQDVHTKHRHLSVPAVVAFWASLFALVWFLWDPPRVFSHAILLVLPVLLLAAIGLVSTIRKRESVRGMSYAIAAIVLISVMAPHIYRDAASEQQLRRYCKNQMMALTAAVGFYTSDNESYPLPDNWNDSLIPYMRYSRVLTSSLAERIPYKHAHLRYLPTYAMNSNLVGLSPEDIAQPDKTVVLFESVPGANLAGGPELLPSPPRYRIGYVIGFADGHAELVREDKIDSLIWDPRDHASRE